MANKPVGAAAIVFAVDAVSQDEINRYVRAVTTKNAAEKEAKGLRDRILTHLEADQPCPNGGPFIIELTYQERCAHEWKEICLEVVARLPKEEQDKAMTFIAEQLDDKKDVAQLNIKPNLEWRTNG